MADKRLFIYRNAAGADGKVLNLRARDSMLTLKKSASKKLGIRARRVFLASGIEVTDVNELQANSTLYFSQGEPFFKAPTAPSNGGGGNETFNVSVLGSGGVGKSALTLRFVQDFFVQDWDPTIMDAYRKSLRVDDRMATLEILDTAGQDDFESLRGQWMMSKDGYIFVYSMDSRISLHELQPFFDLHLQINESRRPLPPIIMVANKKDIIDKDPSKCQISTEEGRRIAQSWNATYIETSALTGANVNAVFENFVREVRKKKVTRVKKTPSCCLL